MQWLTALKLNQSNPGIFYALGLYYYQHERDMVKAQKCLEKCLLLKPDLEDACVLYYQLLIEQGKEVAASEMLHRALLNNPLLAAPQYFLGLISQNQMDF